MGQPAPAWISEQRRAQQAQIDRFHDLDAVILRVEAYAQRANETAAVLARLPNGDGTARLQEAHDLVQLVEIAKHHQANLDRIHLIESPARVVKAAMSGGRR